MKVDYSYAVEQEDIPVRGNIMASGDDAFDKQCEDEALARLERGDVWAWCWVKVTCTITLASGHKIEGYTSLWECCYDNAKDFESSEKYGALCMEAYEMAQTEAQNQVNRGIEIAEALKG